MLLHWPLLTLLIWLPVFGAVCILFVGSDTKAIYARFLALFFSFLSLAVALIVFFLFDSTIPDFQFHEDVSWIPSYGIRYTLGIDGISFPLILLTIFTTFLVILSSWRTVHHKVAQYLASFLLMQGMVIGVFAALDSLLFYIFWEGMLIPMYLSIGIWGSENRSYAAIKFFLFTFLGSALMLVAFLYLRIQSGSFSILSFYDLPLGSSVQFWVFLAFLLAFAVKVPMWPVHTWLPDAHTEAPAGGSVVLAALMLKMGAYGFLRFSLPITPDASSLFAWPMIVLSLIAIVYIGVIAIAQTDMKKLIAYSSVAHMGFVTLGCFMIYLIVRNSGDFQAAYLVLEGALVQMIAHAFGSGAMFLSFGMLYERLHTRLISRFGGIARSMPIFASFFMVFALSNIGFPGTSGFVGEFMIILGGIKGNFWVVLCAATTLVVGAVYTLWMYKRVFYGPVANEGVAMLSDVNYFEMGIFTLAALGVFFIGLYPDLLLQMSHASIEHLLDLSVKSKLT